MSTKTLVDRFNEMVRQERIRITKEFDVPDHFIGLSARYNLDPAIEVEWEETPKRLT